MRLKQAQQKAARAAARRQQQQQQQQEGEQQLPGGHQQPQAAAAAGHLPGLSVSTLAELRLLRAAVQWIARQPNKLQRFQVAAAITALAELLPDYPVNPTSNKPQQKQQQQQNTPGLYQQQQQQQQQVSTTEAAPQDAAHSGGEPAPGSQAHQQQQQDLPGRQQQQQQQRTAAVSGKWSAVHQALLVTLQQQLLPLCGEQVEGLAAGMGRGRQSRYFRLKWAQLLKKCGCGEGSGAPST